MVRKFLVKSKQSKAKRVGTLFQLQAVLTLRWSTCALSSLLQLAPWLRGLYQVEQITKTTTILTQNCQNHHLELK